MQYQITYFSPAGHAERIAEALQRILPSDTMTCRLDANPSSDADIHLVGFDFRNISPSSVPDEIRSFLKGLNGKTILLFATVPFRLSDVVERSVSGLVIPALPRDCDYLGLYLCSAEPPATLLHHMQDSMELNPSNWQASYWHEQCTKAIGHPDETDLQNGCQFAAHVLGLER